MKIVSRLRTTNSICAIYSENVWCVSRICTSMAVRRSEWVIGISDNRIQQSRIIIKIRQYAILYRLQTRASYTP